MQMTFAPGLTHANICPQGNVPVGPSRFIHVEQRRDVRRAPTDSAATPGRNRNSRSRHEQIDPMALPAAAPNATSPPAHVCSLHTRILTAALYSPNDSVMRTVLA